MEKLPGIQSASRSVEVRGYGKVQMLLMAAAMAVAGVLGGCGKPDNLDKCLGEKQAKGLKSQMKNLETKCHGTVGDFVNETKDGDQRELYKTLAGRRCHELSALYASVGRSTDESRKTAILEGDRPKVKSCKIAGKRIKNRISTLMKGDMNKLMTE